MKLASFFSGIAGFDLGFEHAGFETTIQIEIDGNCLKLLAEKFPNAIQIDDIRKIAAMWYRHRTGVKTNEKWQLIFKLLRNASVWCGGFPCQDLSVAGARAGLAGERSGLWFSFRRLVGIFRPPFVVIENVPGLLSSGEGRDFAILISGLEKLGYGVAWRILDAQYFGLAQRRERVFIVGSLGNLSCAEVLFEPESGCWDSAPSRETRERVAPTIEGRAGRSGANNFATSGGLAEVTKSLRTPTGGIDREDMHTLVFGGNRTGGGIDVATACNAHGGTGRHDFESETFLVANTIRTRKGHGCERGDGTDNLIAHTLRAEADASEDGTGRGTPLVIGFGSGGRTHSRQIAASFGVRRLTPTECARLQGFPDDWLEGLGFSDSAKYKMLGNAVAVPVAEFIARRLAAKLRE